MSGEVEKCPILYVCPKFDVFTLSIVLSFSLRMKNSVDPYKLASSEAS